MFEHFIVWLQAPALIKSILAACLALSSFTPAQQSPPVVKPAVVRVHDHPLKGFTQGLFYTNGLLYEGTGLHGKSYLHAFDAVSGKVITSVALERLFGEGIAVLNGKLIQLTWKAGMGLAYSFPGLELIDTVLYGGEGWGLTSDSAQYIMSNGSDTLFFRDKEFRLKRKLAVRANGNPVVHLNELEYARDRIYANVWQRRHLVEIDPGTGNVQRIIDCQPLFHIEKPQSRNMVLNGIAFKTGTGTFYLTGKLWKHIFEVTIPP